MTGFGILIFKDGRKIEGDWGWWKESGQFNAEKNGNIYVMEIKKKFLI